MASKTRMGVPQPSPVRRARGRRRRTARVSTQIVRSGLIPLYMARRGQYGDYGRCYLGFCARMFCNIDIVNALFVGRAWKLTPAMRRAVCTASRIVFTCERTAHGCRRAGVRQGGAGTWAACRAVGVCGGFGNAQASSWDGSGGFPSLREVRMKYYTSGTEVANAGDRGIVCRVVAAPFRTRLQGTVSAMDVHGLRTRKQLIHALGCGESAKWRVFDQ